MRPARRAPTGTNERSCRDRRSFTCVAADLDRDPGDVESTGALARLV
jgi:hypothetical protein